MYEDVSPDANNASMNQCAWEQNTCALTVHIKRTPPSVLDLDILNDLQLFFFPPD